MNLGAEKLGPVEREVFNATRQLRLPEKRIGGNNMAGNPEIRKIMDELWELHSRKDADYAGGDSLGNFRLSEKLGVPAWKGAAIRMLDKVSRFQSLAGKGEGQVKDETMEDTLMDLSMYAMIVLALRREAKKGRGRAETETDGCSMASPCQTIGLSPNTSNFSS